MTNEFTHSAMQGSGVHGRHSWQDGTGTVGSIKFAERGRPTKGPVPRPGYAPQSTCGRFSTASVSGNRTWNANWASVRREHSRSSPRTTPNAPDLHVRLPPPPPRPPRNAHARTCGPPPTSRSPPSCPPTVSHPSHRCLASSLPRFKTRTVCGRTHTRGMHAVMPRTRARGARPSRARSRSRSLAGHGAAAGPIHFLFKKKRLGNKQCSPFSRTCRCVVARGGGGCGGPCGARSVLFGRGACVYTYIHTQHTPTPTPTQTHTGRQAVPVHVHVHARGQPFRELQPSW